MEVRSRFRSPRLLWPQEITPVGTDQEVVWAPKRTWPVLEKRKFVASRSENWIITFWKEGRPGLPLVIYLFICLPRQAEVAQGVPGRLRSRIFLTFRHYKGGRSSAKRTGRLYTRRNPWYSLSEAESTSGHMVLSGVPRNKTPVTPLGIDHHG